MTKMTIDQLADAIFQIEYEASKKRIDLGYGVSNWDWAKAERKAAKRLRDVADAELDLALCQAASFFIVSSSIGPIP